MADLRQVTSLTLDRLRVNHLDAGNAIVRNSSEISSGTSTGRTATATLASTEGGDKNIATGAGGSSAILATAASEGGDITITTGAGGASTNTGASGTGGDIAITVGAGGASSLTAGVGGAGGTFGATAGVGGAGGATGVGGAGGTVTLTAGVGGAVSSTGTGGAGGHINLVPAIAGADVGGTDGVDGAVQINGSEAWLNTSITVHGDNAETDFPILITRSPIRIVSVDITSRINLSGSNVSLARNTTLDLTAGTDITTAAAGPASDAIANQVPTTAALAEVAAGQIVGLAFASAPADAVHFHACLHYAPTI